MSKAPREPYEGCEEECEHGHFGCSRREGGACEAERLSDPAVFRDLATCSLCWEEVGEFETSSGDYVCQSCYVTI